MESDSINHWHECSCGDKDDVATHNFKWVVDKEATATKKGSKHEECKDCGYARPAVEIPATGSTTKPTNPSETNPDTGASDNPQTGDNSNMFLFKILNNKEMERMIESIRKVGAITLALARPLPDGGYELISGHRRLVPVFTQIKTSKR